MTVTQGDNALSSQHPSQRLTRETGPGTSHEATETKSEVSGTGETGERHYPQLVCKLKENRTCFEKPNTCLSKHSTGSQDQMGAGVRGGESEDRGKWTGSADMRRAAGGKQGEQRGQGAARHSALGLRPSLRLRADQSLPRPLPALW